MMSLPLSAPTLKILPTVLLGEHAQTCTGFSGGKPGNAKFHQATGQLEGWMRSYKAVHKVPCHWHLVAYTALFSASLRTVSGALDSLPCYRQPYNDFQQDCNHSGISASPSAMGFTTLKLSTLKHKVHSANLVHQLCFGSGFSL